jgi:hypothetical protein
MKGCVGFFTLLIFSLIFSQTAFGLSIQGRVKDVSNPGQPQQPAAYVRIYIGDNEVQTDQYGSFVIRVDPGFYVFRMQQGYRISSIQEGGRVLDPNARINFRPGDNREFLLEVVRGN